MTASPITSERLAIAGGSPVRAEPLQFHRAQLGPEEAAALVAVLQTGWLTTGPKTRELEERFAARVGAPIGAATNSCTAALHLALLAYGVGHGDEVVTSPMTFAASGNVIVHTGATPVFVDVEPDTLCMDPRATLAALTPRTKAIMPVHFAGHPVDLDPILNVARERGIPVIVDAAHAIETGYQGRPSGTHGDAVCYSFYATKNMTTGEGGMLVTADEEVAEKVRVLRLHGMSRDAFRRYDPGTFTPYQVEEAGWKYNMGDLQAALGLVQLGRLDSMLPRRQEIVDRYDEAFAGLDGVKPLVRRVHATPSACHLYVVQLDTDLLGASRNRVAAAIVAEGVGVGVHFDALHLQPYYRRVFDFEPGLCPVAEAAGASVLSLPLFPDLTDAEVEHVIKAFTKVVRGIGAAG